MTLQLVATIKLRHNPQCNLGGHIRQHAIATMTAYPAQACPWFLLFGGSYGCISQLFRCLLLLLLKLIQLGPSCTDCTWHLLTPLSSALSSQVSRKKQSNTIEVMCSLSFDLEKHILLSSSSTHVLLQIFHGCVMSNDIAFDKQPNNTHLSINDPDDQLPTQNRVPSSSSRGSNAGAGVGLPTQLCSSAHCSDLAVALYGSRHIRKF